MKKSLTSAASAGVTLIEMLIVMAIFAMIGTLTYGTFARSVDASERAEKITTHYHYVRQAMQRMSTEISMAFLSAHKDCDEKRTETIFVGQQTRNGMRLDFTSFSHYKIRKDANESDQNELSYYVDDDPEDDSRTVLMRREQSRIDDEPDEGGTSDILAENIKELHFEFYDSKEDEWEEEWDSTSMDQKGRLPTFVSIKLIALDPKGDEETFVTKTRIFLKRRILITGTGFPGCFE